MDKTKIILLSIVGGFGVLCICYIAAMVVWSEEIKKGEKLSLSRAEDYILERGVCDTDSVFNNSIIVNVRGMDCESDLCRDILGNRASVTCNGPFRPEDYICIEIGVIHQNLPFQIYLYECFTEIDMGSIITNNDPTDNKGFEIVVAICTIFLVIIAFMGCCAYCAHTYIFVDDLPSFLK